MKTLLIFFSILLSFWICGCSSKKQQVELTRENISGLHDTSKLEKVYILCHGGDPNRRQMPYFYEFPINPTKGHVILRYIEDANQSEFDRERLSKKRIGEEGTSGLFVFETKKAIYSTRIGWNDKSVFGYWWESADLLSVFKGWGLFEDIAKADPNWPPPEWMRNPPREMDPNWPGQEKAYLRGQE
jgi:hypothetical protein